MKQEFAQLIVNELKLLLGPALGATAADTIYFGKIPSKGKRTFPCILVKESTSVDTMQTTTNPLSDVVYEVHVFGKYPGTSTDESLATRAMQDSGQLCDTLSELLRNDSVLRALCLDFRSRGTRFVPPEMNKQNNDYSESSMMVELHVTFNTNGGIYGISNYGEAMYGF